MRLVEEQSSERKLRDGHMGHGIMMGPWKGDS
jgi:hypothetical protein